jgi:hypothetical protein
MPAAVEFHYQNFGNWKTYFNRPVEPERERGLNLEPSERFGPYTSETAKIVSSWIRKTERVPFLGKTMGFIVHGREVKDVSPRQVDNMIRGLTAGIGSYYAVPALDRVIRLVMRNTKAGKDLGIGAAKPEQEGPQKIPVVRALLGKRGQYGSDVIDKAYELMEESERAYNTYRHRKGESAERYLEDQEKAKLVAMYESMLDTRRALTALNRAKQNAARAGRHEDAFQLQKEMLHVAKTGMERAENAAADPTAINAVRIGRIARQMRAEQDQLRQSMKLTIEDLVNQKDFKQLRAVVGELPPEQRRWAMEYARQYRKERGRNREQRALEKVPKRFRKEVTKRASEQAQ